MSKVQIVARMTVDTDRFNGIHESLRTKAIAEIMAELRDFPGRELTKWDGIELDYSEGRVVWRLPCGAPATDSLFTQRDVGWIRAAARFAAEHGAYSDEIEALEEIADRMGRAAAA